MVTSRLANGQKRCAAKTSRLANCWMRCLRIIHGWEMTKRRSDTQGPIIKGGRRACVWLTPSNVGSGSVSSNATLPVVAVPASTEPDDVHPTHFGLKCRYENQARGFSLPANAGRAGSSVRCAADTCRLCRRDDQRRHFYDAVGTTARA
jgi:hypothetical protein